MVIKRKNRIRLFIERLLLQGSGWRYLKPVSDVFGLDRGLPIDRYYIEKFLQEHSADIQGRTIEIAAADYTSRFGGKRVIQSDVLDVASDNPQATIIGNLATGQGLPREVFDCFILTQTLPFIYDFRSVVQHVYQSLKPGGVVLATFPGISQISRYDMERWGDYWRFTTKSARCLFQEFFPGQQVSVWADGNVRVAIAFLHGLAVHELTRRELDYHDSNYEVIITVRAQKPTS